MAKKDPPAGVVDQGEAPTSVSERRRAGRTRAKDGKAPGTSRSRGARTKQGHDTLTAYLMLVPMFALLTTFVIVPLIYAAAASFYDWSFYTDSVFVGWDNYLKVLRDEQFTGSLVRGLHFAAIVVPTGLVVAFFIASVITGLGKRVASIVKVAVYIPTVISGVIASIVFAFIYNYSGGFANWVLSLFGSEPVAWLNTPAIAMYAIALPAVWLGVGLSTLILVAAMLEIPDSYYEAARLDGAGWWRCTFSITIPMLRNVFLFLFITGFTASIQQLELPLVMTGGGPLNSTLLPNLYIFNHFRNDAYVGQSIASALLLFVVVGSVSALIFRVLNSEKAIDG